MVDLKMEGLDDAATAELFEALLVNKSVHTLALDSNEMEVQSFLVRPLLFIVVNGAIADANFCRPSRNFSAPMMCCIPYRSTS